MTSSKSCIIETRGDFWLEDESGMIEEGKKAVLSLNEENLYIQPKMGNAILIPLRDIFQIYKSDYQIILTLSSYEKLYLYKLGYQFDDLYRAIRHSINELTIKDLLMYEKLKLKDIKADYTKTTSSKNKSITEQDTCLIRLYETALVVIPDNNGNILRLPYCFIDNINEADSYGLHVSMASGEEWVFTKLGKFYKQFYKSLTESLNILSLETQEYLRKLVPNLSLSLVRKAALILKDGRGASKQAIDGMSPEIWPILVNHLEKAGIKEEYDYLSSFSIKDLIHIGFKRGFSNEQEAHYLWFFIPIVNPALKGTGNTVAFEASGEDGGRATYFFRIMDDKKLSLFTEDSELYKIVQTYIRQLNENIVAINFRREPIYISEDKLSEDLYSRYRESISKIPELQQLREAFIGRVIHRSKEQWVKDVSKLLELNPHYNNSIDDQ